MTQSNMLFFFGVLIAVEIIGDIWPGSGTESWKSLMVIKVNIFLILSFSHESTAKQSLDPN